MAAVMKITEVPPYVSDEEEDINGNVQVERKTTKKKHHKWMKEMVLNNAGEAKQAMINEGVWNEYYTNTAAYEKKKIFRCNQVKHCEKQCMLVFICCLV